MRSERTRRQRLTPRRGVGLRAAVLLALLAWGSGAAAGQPLTQRAVEKKMVAGGYLDTLWAAYWAVDQGPAIVPILAAMLARQKRYEAAQGGATGAFPFNALWALAHIPAPAAQAALEQYYARSRDATAALALKGFKLRQAHPGPPCGVLLNDSELLAAPQENSQVRQQLPAGQPLEILQEKVENAQEEGPRGGPAYYDRVRLLPGGPEGYIRRAGDGFSPVI